MKVKVTHETNEYFPELIINIRFDNNYNIGLSMPIDMPLKYVKRYERDIIRLIERDNPQIQQ
jgi:hypothetical protein